MNVHAVQGQLGHWAVALAHGTRMAGLFDGKEGVQRSLAGQSQGQVTGCPGWPVVGQQRSRQLGFKLVTVVDVVRHTSQSLESGQVPVAFPPQPAGISPGQDGPVGRVQLGVVQVERGCLAQAKAGQRRRFADGAFAHSSALPTWDDTAARIAALVKRAAA